MANWKAVGTAFQDALRLWYLDFAAAILDRDKSWREVWRSMWDRAEEVQQHLVQESRQAGVRHPLIWMSVLSKLGSMLWLLALRRWPRRTLGLSLAAWVLPTLWAMTTLLLRRQTPVSRRAPLMGSRDDQRHHPLVS